MLSAIGVVVCHPEERSARCTLYLQIRAMAGHLSWSIQHVFSNQSTRSNKPVTGQPTPSALVVGSLPETVYTPESALKKPRQLVRDMLRDLYDSRELAWRLFVRDLRAQYRQSLLGYVWLFLPPLASTLLFVFLRSQQIIEVGSTPIPYPLYVLTGVVLWEVFAASIHAPLKVVGGAIPMLSKMNFPRESLLMCGAYQVLFGLCIKCLLLAVAFVWFGTQITSLIFLSPLAILALMILGFSLGLMLVPIGLLYQDIGRAMTMALSAWFLLTPVIFPPPTNWPASILSHMNPVSPMIVTAREMLTSGELSMQSAFLLITGLSFILLLLAWVLYRISMPHLIARMSA